MRRKSVCVRARLRQEGWRRKTRLARFGGPIVPLKKSLKAEELLRAESDAKAAKRLLCKLIASA